MSKVILSYNDSLILESDLDLLASNNWLNDRLIAFVYEYLERDGFEATNNKRDLCGFVNPSTVHYLTGDFLTNSKFI